MTRNLLDLVIGCSLFMAFSLTTFLSRKDQRQRLPEPKIALLPAPSPQQL